MKTLCPNLDREDGLETVLEVPIPEEIFTHKSGTTKVWENMKSWMKPNAENKTSSASMAAVFGRKNTEIQLLLGVVGAPLIPSVIISDNQPITRSIKDKNIEASMAKYIVKQYVAAVGGERALNSVDSMYAMGQVKMATLEFSSGEGNVTNKKIVKVKNMDMKGEMGGFVMWQKRPELWCLELVVSGYKISAGSDGKVAWRQTPWHHSHASRGPPRPLRRFLQGLDPSSTANLFSNSICIGEKTIDNEDCFILKMEAESSSLRARSNNNVEIVRHTVWGYFSQRTGLLVHLEDSHLLKLKSIENDTIYWETNMESHIYDYRTVDGIQVAHAGKTLVSLFRFGEAPETRSRTRMEEAWQVEEVDFNIKGLSIDCFLPPSDLKMEQENGKAECGRMIATNNAKLPDKIRSASFRISASKVAAVNLDDSCTSESDEDL
ncbi:hypothetical protein Lal_00001260 [Lupinus albus]|uniref:Uncharacterized protein n=1 Tax=Lupinus albus TaxID=3870 RepID=A0A6A5P1R0_LUPAL|nr:hypothetical protein Lalb_Chr18g0052861 [Lupinus albus]KAF1891121.1 hypothetical protein Lal_00001260 [Lupinus albus]